MKLTIITPLWPNKSHQASPRPQQPFPTHEVYLCQRGKTQQSGIVPAAPSRSGDEQLLEAG